MKEEKTRANNNQKNPKRAGKKIWGKERVKLPLTKITTVKIQSIDKIKS